MNLRKDVHGGNVYRARDEYGISIGEILDYSANINPLGVPESLQKAIMNNMNLLTRYPDPDYTGAKRSLAEFNHVNESNIIMGNGATEIIFLIMEVLKPKKVLIPCPSFSEYEQAALFADCEVEHYRIKEEEDYILDSRDLMESLTEDIEMLVLCNPNNPTSQIIERKPMKDILDFCREKGITVVIDEAFIDFVDEEFNISMVDELSVYPNLFIIKALTKIFAIPGLRLGYGIGSERLIKRLELKKQPWTLNNMASLAAEILPKDRKYIEETKKWIKAERLRFFSKLSSINGIKVYEPFCNFILIKLLDDRLTSYNLCEKMAQKGILVRNAANFIFLDEKYIRIAIKDQRSNDIFLEKFVKTLEEVKATDGIYT